MSKASSWPWGDGSYRYFSSPFSLFSAFSAPPAQGKAVSPETGHRQAEKGGVVEPRRGRWSGPPSPERRFCGCGSASSPGPDLLAPRHVGSLAAVASGCRRSPAPQLQGQPWKEPSDTTTRPLKGSWGALRLWNLRSRHPRHQPGLSSPRGGRREGEKKTNSFGLTQGLSKALQTDRRTSGLAQQREEAAE